MSEVIKPENFRLVTMTQNLQNPKKVVKLIEKYQFVSQNVHKIAYSKAAKPHKYSLDL